MTDPFLAYCQKPDRERLARFIVAYTDPVTRLVRRVVGCADATQDVVQETFVRLSTSDPRIDDVPSPRAYVLRTALNLAREHLRRGKVRAYHEIEAAKVHPTMSPSAAEEAIAKEQIERLYRAIDSLPDPLRVAMHLRAIENLSYKEIAAVTGASVGATGMRIQKARGELRRRLGDGQVALAWANLDVARRRGWFPAGTELSPEAIDGIRKAAGRTGRTVAKAPCAYTGIAVLASLSLVGLATTRVLGPQPAGFLEEKERTTVSPKARDFGIEPTAPPVAATSEPEKPTAPVVAGTETETSDADGAQPTESVGRSSVRESEGGEAMTGRKTLVASTVLAVGIAAAASGAETGDLDGDGRLTIADVFVLEDGREPAEGSLSGFESFPCYPDPDNTAHWLETRLPTMIYLESLRRGVAGSLPHWDSVWPEDVEAEPLLEDARGEIELLPWIAPGDASDRAHLSFKLTVLAPVRAFSVVLEAPPGLLEAPAGGFDGVDPFYNSRLWRSKYEALEGVFQMHRFGDLPVAVTTHAYLITGGRYVVTYDMGNNRVFDDIQPGEYLVTVEARLALHTTAGSYPLEVHPASEILFADGTFGQPVVSANSQLTIESDVTEGLDDGIPPLEVDPEKREVLGAVEFRLVDGDGNPPEPGEPVVEALNDEQIKVRLQLRTEVPLNRIRYRLRWRTDDGLDFQCEKPPTVVFARPDGGEYLPWAWTGAGVGTDTNQCGTVFGIGEAQAIFALAGSDNTQHAHNRRDRPLEYFRPLGEWLDIVELKLQVPDEAVGGTEVRLAFQTEFGSTRKEIACFTPYGEVYPCNPDRWPEDDVYWKYNVIFHDSFIRVRGNAEPPPPPDLGIRFALGTASGAPGELVEVPILGASLFPLRRLRLALRLDPAILSAEGVEIDILDDRTGTVVQETIGRPGSLGYRVCDEQNGQVILDSCTTGVPGGAWFRNTDPSFILLDLFPGNRDYPGDGDGRFAEIGRFLVRVAEDAIPGVTTLTPAVAPFTEGGFEVLVESGGNTQEGGPYSPAREVIEGAVVIVDDPRSGDLVRGDANDDGAINISDAALMLGALFTEGVKLECEDAADVDDNGALNITDAILLLGVLFGGDGELPPPHECGPDPSADALSCEEGCIPK